jgi:hypothetical protein
VAGARLLRELGGIASLQRRRFRPVEVDLVTLVTETGRDSITFTSKLKLVCTPWPEWRRR